MIRIRLLGAALALAPIAAVAQHTYSPAGATYDARVPTPRSVLGYNVGDRFTPHDLVLRYFERVALASRRVHLDTLGRTFEGREYITAVVTSERNQQRLDQILGDARRLADPRGASQGDLDAAMARMPAIVLLAHTIHQTLSLGTGQQVGRLLAHHFGEMRDEHGDRIDYGIAQSAGAALLLVYDPDGRQTVSWVPGRYPIQHLALAAWVDRQSTVG